MAEERVQVDVGEDGVADVRLVRGDKHNGLDWAMFSALNTTLDELGTDETVRAVVLSGDGPSFCAGLDFKNFSPDQRDPDVDMFAHHDGNAANFAQRAAYGWRALPVPVIAALHGACFGGGAQIALAADMRIAAPDTKFSIMEMRYGLIPDMGLSQTLPGLVRDDVARDLVYSARIVEATEAAELGLITRISDDALADARALAAEIATKSPSAIRAAKRLVGEFATTPEGLALEEELQRQLLGSPDQLAAVASALA